MPQVREERVLVQRALCGVAPVRADERGGRERAADRTGCGCVVKVEGDEKVREDDAEELVGELRRLDGDRGAGRVLGSETSADHPL